jgi:hypothetical protein
MEIEPNSTFNIKINDTIVPYTILDGYRHGSDLWYEAWLIWGDDIMLIVCNITIPENSSIVLKYEIDTSKEINLDELDELTIFYVVGTSRLWSGNITESVEFKVQGKIPHKYYKPINKSCIVSKLPDGKSYLWEWKNEIIPDKSVYIVYYGGYNDSLFPLTMGVISFSIICFIVFIGIVGIMRLKNLKRKKLV